jgi:hypothetical protein
VAQQKRVPMNVAIAFLQKGYPSPQLPGSARLRCVSALPGRRVPGMYKSRRGGPSAPRGGPPRLPSYFPTDGVRSVGK